MSKRENELTYKESTTRSTKGPPRKFKRTLICLLEILLRSAPTDKVKDGLSRANPNTTKKKMSRDLKNAKRKSKNWSKRL